jgi:AhpD family alkylhydroperoxidase
MRVPAKGLSRYPLYLRPFFWNQRRKYGEVLQAALLWARSPKLFVAVAILYGVIDRRTSPIDPTLRSLVTVRVSQINNCTFCVDLNSSTLLKRGVSTEKVEALGRWRQSSLFDAREQTVLGYAEAVTRSDYRIEDGMIESLRRYFDDDAIVELTALIAFQNMSSKFNSALGAPAQGFCKRPGAAGLSHVDHEVPPVPRPSCRRVSSKLLQNAPSMQAMRGGAIALVQLGNVIAEPTLLLRSGMRRPRIWL